MSEEIEPVTEEVVDGHVVEPAPPQPQVTVEVTRSRKISVSVTIRITGS